MPLNCRDIPITSSRPLDAAQTFAIDLIKEMQSYARTCQQDIINIHSAFEKEQKALELDFNARRANEDPIPLAVLMDTLKIIADTYAGLAEAKRDEIARTIAQINVETLTRLFAQLPAGTLVVRGEQLGKVSEEEARAQVEKYVETLGRRVKLAEKVMAWYRQ
ncbi:hypothetical protein BU23DRAFT_551231 [Bimuria novae-zelandiae CBS 107.79]|uniref:Uncharacterized protein n=1 Tax=Bimuria novae-zelandiae CBS 107.79 TaxID=1447943 RepID=A0A6A5VIF8_9PLEO|nr:hypothetical protein BU23DRAFT_551231 [Bimuria novae-zelandiae CBS 107.79]